MISEGTLTVFLILYQVGLSYRYWRFSMIGQRNGHFTISIACFLFLLTFFKFSIVPFPSRPLLALTNVSSFLDKTPNYVCYLRSSWPRSLAYTEYRLMCESPQLQHIQVTVGRENLLASSASHGPGVRNYFTPSRGWDLLLPLPFLYPIIPKQVFRGWFLSFSCLLKLKDEAATS